MFDHAHSNYMKFAFPRDELKPMTRSSTNTLAELGNAKETDPRSASDRLRSSGRPYRGSALTLIDSLSTLAVLGDHDKFCATVEYILHAFPNFDIDLRVHNFETNIRILGSLLSAHLILTDPIVGPTFIGVSYTSLREDIAERRRVCEYKNNQLLNLACDLGDRLMKAFPPRTAEPAASSTTTKSSTSPPPAAHSTKEQLRHEADTSLKQHWSTSAIPHAFVHLSSGLLPNEVSETCTAGVSTLLLEFGLLSALTGNMTYKHAADSAMQSVWQLRSPTTGLLPNTFDRKGNIHDPISSLGSGIDSTFEYLLKAAILFDDHRYMDMFQRLYEANERHLKISVVQPSNDAPSSIAHRLRSNLPSSTQQCAASHTQDWYLESDMSTGRHIHFQLNALAAFYPSLQVLSGRVDEARSFHQSILEVWTRYNALPERYFFLQQQVHNSEKHYVLRPEFIESTYYLYRATRDTRYLEVGEQIIRDINQYCRVSSGFAGLSSVLPNERQHIDRMESFFLAETLKYLYLLFDVDDENWVHMKASPASSSPSSPSPSPATSWMFSTEGHLFPIRGDLQAFGDRRARETFGIGARANAADTLTREAVEDLEIWDTIRRYQQAALMRREDVVKAELQSPSANPILREYFQHSGILQTHASTVMSSQISGGNHPNWGPAAGTIHKWAHIFRYREGFFHHPLISRGSDPIEYEREYQYHLDRILGTLDAFGGEPNAAIPLSRIEKPFSGYRRLASLNEAELVDLDPTPMTVTSHLARRRRSAMFGSAPSGVMCAVPSHLWLRGRSPKYWWAYDAQWRRWLAKRKLDARRLKEYERWQLAEQKRQQQLQQQQPREQQRQKGQDPIHHVDAKVGIGQFDMYVQPAQQIALADHLQVVHHGVVALLVGLLGLAPERRRVRAGSQDRQAISGCDVRNGATQHA